MMDNPQTLKLLRGNKPPLTKEDFLFMVKSLSKLNTNSNETIEKEGEIIKNRFKKSNSIKLMKPSSEKTLKRLNSNLSQKRDNNSNNNTDNLDSTFSTNLSSVTSGHLPTPPKEDVKAKTERSFVFKKKRIIHFRTKSPQKFNTLTYDNYQAYTQNKNEIEINIEDLILIEEKFNEIKITITKNKPNFVNKVCFDWWNFYFNCCFNGRIERFFVDYKSKKIVNLANLYSLLGMIIIYEISFDRVLLLNNKNVLLNMLSLHYNIYINICEFLVSKIRKEYLSSFWVEKLKSIIQKNIKDNNWKNNGINFNDKLHFYSNCISEYIKLLLISLNNPLISDIFQNITTYTPAQINLTFLTEIIHIGNANGSIPFCQNQYQYQTYSYSSKTNKSKEEVLLKMPPKKNLTLVLDLDETLMCFIVNPKDPNQGFSRLRPFLYEFLNKVSLFYELIVFTAATKDYADPILDAMEKNKRYFDMRLYRENCVIIEGDYVKDISKMGRKVENVIIVDNMQQNFKLQKENGILITSFWGEDRKDKALQELGNILLLIAKEFNNNNNTDVRVLLKKYKEDIVKNVSCR